MAMAFNPPNKGCIQSVNRAVHLFNINLRATVDNLKKQMTAANLVFVNSYKIIRDIIKNPSSKGKFYPSLIFLFILLHYLFIHLFKKTKVVVSSRSVSLQLVSIVFKHFTYPNRVIYHNFYRQNNVTMKFNTGPKSLFSSQIGPNSKVSIYSPFHNIYHTKNDINIKKNN